jgi:paraquat-inducible protein B
MRKRTDAAVIGAFVIGAIVLGAAALVLWGSGRLFRETAKYVCYFEGSVEGLDVGAPVKARGVAIGRVVRVQLRYRQRRDDDRIPVFIEVDVKRLVESGGDRPGTPALARLVGRGLRARLESQSFVTGALFVNIGLYPGTPVIYSEVETEGGTPEIPTIPRALAGLTQSVSTIVSKLEAVDFSGMASAIAGAASSIDRLASRSDLSATLRETNATLESYRQLAGRLDTQLTALLGELRLTVGDARKAVVGLDGAAGAASRLVAPEAPLSVRLNEALGGVTRAADAVHDLADYLQRNPSSLLVGKKP